LKKRLLSLVLTVILVASLGFNVSAKGESPDKNQMAIKKGEAIQRLKDLSGGKVKVYTSENGQMFISGKLSDKSTTKALNTLDALKQLEDNKAIFGLEDVYNSFKLLGQKVDELGFTHINLQQTLNGLPIEGKIMVVHYNKEGIVTAINGDVENKISTVTKLGSKSISKEEAIKNALKEISYTKLNKTKADKVIYIKDNSAYEVYKVNVGCVEPMIGEWNIYVEAYSGKIIKKEDRMRQEGPVTGTGYGADGTVKPLNLYLSGTTYQMKDTTKPMTGQVITYTANHTQTEQYQLVTNTSSVFNSEDYKAAVDAHYFGGVVYDFYKNLFNRNSIDGNGMSIISTVHYGSSYNNAGWGNDQIVYGDGDGSRFTYLSGDLDVIGHEMTHGVTDKTANLTYEFQSGALNESMSDMLGVLIETYDKYNVKNGGAWTFDTADWVVGDEIYTPGTPGDALRSLVNPTLYNQPAHMDNYRVLPNTQDGDWGGVHINSGIPNKAGYLTVQAIGCEKTANIWYRALTTYMTASTDFLGARNALVQAATDLYGANGAEVTAINNGFDAVGVIPFNDPYEINNTLAQAYQIGLGTTYNSYIASASDVDYYKFTTTQSGTITVNLTSLPKDYDLYLYNASGTQIGKSSNGSTTAEKITYTGAAGTYYAKVVGYSGAYSTATKYALKVDFGGTPTDTYEPNDTTAQAYGIASGTTYNSFVYSSTDVDYYKFTVASAKTITINLTNLPKDYDLYLYNSAGTLVAKSENGSTTSEAISYSAAAGTYYVKVVGYSGAYSTTAQYALKATY